MMEFKTELSLCAQEVQAALDTLVPLTDYPQRSVIEAMRYSLLNGGKRLRAALLLHFCTACGGSEEQAMPFACALEMIHAYSLIHDDLPCMDDDDLRRGKPSCHIAYGEATALLAGDALLTHAFTLMMKHGTYSAQTRLAAMLCLSEAVGVYGMIGGQVMDLANEHRDDVTAERLKETDGLKTGALIAAACKMGCILGGGTPEQIEAANSYAQKIGLAFQITDDILDVVSTTEELGKPVGSDREKNKVTYVTIYGVDGAKKYSEQLLSEAKRELEKSGLDTPFLLAMTDYILLRKN